MSSQSVTIPCSMGYLILSNPRNSCAFRPMNTSPSSAPAMTRMCFGRPTLHDVPPDTGRYTLANASRGSRDGPNREDAQGREETFWMVLPSKASLYRARALASRAATQAVSTRRAPTIERGLTLSMTTGWFVSTSSNSAMASLKSVWLLCQALVRVRRRGDRRAEMAERRVAAWEMQTCVQESAYERGLGV